MESLGRVDHLRAGRDDSVSGRLERIVELHGARVLSVTRRFSESSVDAEDAYQQALRVFIEKVPEGLDEGSAVGWLLVVARNEAITIRRREAVRRSECLDGELEAEGIDASVADSLIGRDAFAQGVEALNRLHPDFARCLLLRAEGMAYPEICEVTGFSYSKVNRCLTRGRKALRAQLEEISTGRECVRIVSQLSSFVDDECDAREAKLVKAHLRHCHGCRVTMREYRTAPKRLAGLLPLGTVFSTPGGLFGRLGETAHNAVASVLGRLGGIAGSAQQSSEIGTAKKLAIVTLVSSSLIGGGYTVSQAVDNGGSVLPGDSGQQWAARFDAPAESSDTGVSDSGKAKGDSGVTADTAPREPTLGDLAGRESPAGQSSANLAGAPAQYGGSAGDTGEFAEPPSEGAATQPADPAPAEPDSTNTEFPAP